NVTGVQTCALPIFLETRLSLLRRTSETNGDTPRRVASNPSTEEGRPRSRQGGKRSAARSDDDLLDSEETASSPASSAAPHRPARSGGNPPHIRGSARDGPRASRTRRRTAGTHRGTP